MGGERSGEEGAKKARHPEILANIRFHYHGTFTDLFTAKSGLHKKDMFH